MPVESVQKNTDWELNGVKEGHDRKTICKKLELQRKEVTMGIEKTEKERERQEGEKGKEQSKERQYEKQKGGEKIKLWM